MSHLSLEMLARLLDGPADAVEAAHLAECAECRAELEALREQTGDLGDLPDLEPPPDNWPAIAARLREEGLLREVRRGRPAWTRLAASLAIFLLGSVAGFTLRSGPAADGGADAPLAAADAGAATTAEQATRELRVTEAAYLAALNQYAELAEPSDTGDLVTRAAALEGILLTTRAALDQAPADPVINGYHLSALAQRESTLRQISFSPGEPWF